MIDFKRPKSPTPMIELTPMIDVIFQLLIFFMISSSFLYPAIALNLPKLTAEESSVKEPALTLTLQQNDQYLLNHEAIEKSQLESKIKAALDSSTNKSLHFRADKDVPYEKILNTLQTAGKAGVAQLHFVYQESDNSHE